MISAYQKQVMENLADTYIRLLSVQYDETEDNELRQFALEQKSRVKSRIMLLGYGASLELRVRR